MIPPADRCPGVAAVFDPGWPMSNAAEPVGLTVSVPFPCPTCRGTFVRWEFLAGVMTHPVAPAPAVTKTGRPEEVRVPAVDPGRGMDAGELADAVAGLPRETRVKGEAGFRGQIRAVTFRR